MEAQAQSNKKVLVIDDTPEALETVGLLLENVGFTVKQASSTIAALEAFEGDTFDLVVSDISLPGDLNGVQLAKIFRQKRPGQSIILMTGYSDYAALGAKDFNVLRKPFCLSDLRDAIRDKLRLALAASASPSN